ncbi:MAG: L,D-transpeptidase [Ignavibacteriae bacterium]|nr:L,D-transpeptidase [Ignavibacteriota bacterium]
MDKESDILQDDLSLPPEDDYSEKLVSVSQSDGKKSFLIYIFPALLSIILCLGIPVNLESNPVVNTGFYEIGSNSTHSNFSINILSEKDLSSGLKDTVYTDKDCWLELRIDQQMLYQHWRDGKLNKYPISTGNKYLSRSIESRPGLFAIFVKEELHESSQYNNAKMFYFMPFNQGIGFHSLAGTGYYGNLGVAPSSHGCIRMRHEDVKKLFKDCPLGTIVIAHRGYSARTIGFAPKEYKNTEEYTKDEYKKMLAENLSNILEGYYYTKDRKFFVVDPKIIPVSGVYISYDKKIPEKQKLNKSVYSFKNNTDWLSMREFHPIINKDINDSDLKDLINVLIVDEKEVKKDVPDNILSDVELIKKYFHNPIGILPYFPPNKD